jgi:hypothetical protein
MKNSMPFFSSAESVRKMRPVKNFSGQLLMSRWLTRKARKDWLF